MMSSLYIGATGVKTHGEGLNSVANNLANVNTLGYKQSSLVFADLFSENLPMGSTWGQGFSQKGLGAQVGSERTLFSQGSFEPGNTATDMSISGKGFFQVVDGDKTHYTRAGNFRFDAEGFLKDPNGYVLSGYPMTDGKISGGLTGIRLDPNNKDLFTTPPKASTSLASQLNLGVNKDNSFEGSENPYFSMVESWDATKSGSPLDASAHTGSQPLKVYDASGTAHTLNVYFDAAPDTTGGQTFEYVVAANPADLVGEDGTPSPGTGLLMSGTLRFSASGKLMDMTAFTPTDGTNQDLSTWKPATLSGGIPQFNVQFAGQPAQALTLDLGVHSTGNAWKNPAASAADVGKDFTLLPGMEGATPTSEASTAFKGASNTKNYRQDGYAQGDLLDITITTEGTIRASYTNSQTKDLFSIPVARFTSEDGLRREGMNHYSAPPEAGAMELGMAGTSNYGKILASQLETSNVDMSREMVNLIIMQRGLQTNSKTITTADTMLQKALEIKRN